MPALTCDIITLMPHEPVYLCTLEYLVGSMATAYKGSISSLVMRDFCICETSPGGGAAVSGQLVGFPAEGGYVARLLSQGVADAEAPIEDGRFELHSEALRIERAGSMQIDVVREGRHVGTFLLKRAPSIPGEAPSPFVSALELSEETRDINFRALVGMLADRPGLHDAAQALARSILSVKRDWRALSAAITTLARDMFWPDRKAFMAWYPALARFSALAAHNAGRRPGDKTVGDFLGLLALALDNERDRPTRLAAIGVWTHEADGRLVPLALGFDRAIMALGRIRGEGPHAREAYGLAARALLRSLVEHEPRGLDERTLGILGDERLAPYSGLRLSALRREAGLMGAGPEPPAPEALAGLGGLMIRDDEMVEALGAALASKAPSLAPEVLGEVAGLVMTGLDGYSAQARQGLQNLMVSLIEALAAGHERHTVALVEALGRAGAPGREALLLGRAMRAMARAGRGVREACQAELLRVVVPPPGISGFSEQSWAEQADPAHVRTLAALMEAISGAGGGGEGDGAAEAVALAHLIANLAISGVFIPDDRLFQRNVSAYLNAVAPQGPARMRLRLMLMRRLPVFHAEVGASGRVRDLSTRLDSWGDDTALYFLRKQVHVNASSRNVRLTECMISAWAEGSAGPLKGQVPPDVEAELSPARLASYQGAMRGALGALGALGPSGRISFGPLGRASSAAINAACPGGAPEQQKVRLLLEFYVEVRAKYTRGAPLAGGAGEAPGPLEALDAALAGIGAERPVLLDPEVTEATERLYYKRHIAFGIPSVIGTYNEPRFDALGRWLGCEERARASLEALISALEAEASPGAGQVREGLEALGRVERMMALGGLGNPQARELASTLGMNQLEPSQVLDLMGLWQRELNWTVETLYREFGPALRRLLAIYPMERLPGHLARIYGGGGPEGEARLTDVLMRDLVVSIPGLDELDRLINALRRAVGLMAERAPDNIPITGGRRAGEAAQARLYRSDEPGASVEGLGPTLGAKARNLYTLREAGIETPPFVVFPSAWTWDAGDMDIEAPVREAVAWLEGVTGRRLGGPEAPLLLAIRSGSMVSMPGILESILYAGMSDEAALALTREGVGGRAAWDAMRRFIEHYAVVALEVGEGALGAEARDLGAPGEMDEAGLRALVARYRAFLGERGLSIPGDPMEQAVRSVRAIYASWDAPRALGYRRAMGLSERWGTGVLVMPMVMANAEGAGASVFFTSRPFEDGATPYGETVEGASGDDLVYGRLINRPLSLTQETPGGAESLQRIRPPLYEAHAGLAREIERAMGGLPQEVEAAYLPTGRIVTLQTKRMEFSRGTRDRFDEVCAMQSRRIGRGIGVHGGAISGVATFLSDPGGLRRLRERTGGGPLVLIRPETSTDDAGLMPLVDGLLTMRGGAASHASILAQKFDLTAVVGCQDLVIGKDEAGAASAVIGGREIGEGSAISIDGATGLVYDGLCEFTVPEPM